ncbi:sugar transferase [Nocardioides jishulii]|uniref:Sugar transferase n=1 Tax=Nocardioides jishulii TaxID=2575440 RepID=A0A4U2YIU2_9ACTN|nr:sugar transferase [Nocardioides jishulii]QCX26645.1 sugar transferase [Nocardioides jishulii]TKI60385.1 sugar transferase [Nocardioides jishulii]
MALVALLVSASADVVLGVIACSLVVRFWSGPTDLVRPGLPRLSRVLHDAGAPFFLAAAMVTVGLWGRPELVASAWIALAGMGVTALAVLARHLVPTPQRVVVVGSAVDVAEAATRWAGSREVTVVGGLVIDAAELGVARPSTSLVKGFLDLSKEIDADELIGTDPDMVLVVPGPGIDPECLRRIGWALEGTRTALAVQSQLDGIAPHRVEHTSYAGATIMRISSSRPAALPLALKGALDRLVGAVLLLLAGPLLGVLVMAIRITSDGPGIFRQVRVGKDGSLFVMYKLRTMATTAEADKAALMAANEGSGVLFKMSDDPRVTPLGRVLRRFSVDELPQLVNVIKGEMSLVGPRPALPEEVAQYSSLERRRLASKPGLTGLWQVSGRSDLTWEESVRLDNHYTENWRLTDDVTILARTVNAVLGSRGAY